MSDDKHLTWSTASDRGRSKDGWTLKRANKGKHYYEVCDYPTIEEPTNWLFTSYRGAQAQSTVFISASVEYDNGKSLEVYYYEVKNGERDIGNTRELRSRFKKLKKSDDESKGVIKRHFTLSDDAKGYYVAFKDSGTCARLNEYMIIKYFCPETRFGLAVFPKSVSFYLTNAVQGKCVMGAEPKKESAPPRGSCTLLGNLMNTVDTCVCSKGYKFENGKCNKCSKNTYKSEAGNFECQQCPFNSGTSLKGAQHCECLHSYFRSPSEPYSMPCGRLPSAPRDLIAEVDYTTVTLSWSPPINRQFRDHVFYALSCDECSTAEYSINDINVINDTKLVIMHLEPNRNYTFIVKSLNSLVDASTMPASVKSINIRTYPPPIVGNVVAAPIGTSAVNLSWRLPKNVSVPKHYSYLIEVMKDNSDFGKIPENKTSHLFTHLYHGHYAFRIAVVGVSRKQQQFPFSEYVYLQIPSNLGISGKMSFNSAPNIIIMSGIVGTVALILLIILFSALCLLRKRHQKWSKVPGAMIEYPISDRVWHYSEGRNTLMNSKEAYGQSFIDPIYSNLDEMLEEFTKEIPENYISVEKESVYIGGGSFTERGIYQASDQYPIFVAVKMVSAMDSVDVREQFAMEAVTIGQFNHPNVLQFHGVSLKNSPLMMILEHTSGGDLSTLLMQNEKLSSLQLVHMLRGVACGMQYLSDMMYVHKVLAAHSVLVSGNGVCKIAGFDLRIQLDQEVGAFGDQPISANLVPWTAPEVFAMRKFSTASDVWSFGILLWEVISMGERPYWNWTNFEIMKAVDGGYRLPAPRGCPSILFDIMLQCWSTERNYRPGFSKLREALEHIIRSPSSLDTSPKSPNTLPRSHIFSAAPTIPQFLHQLKLKQYEGLFSMIDVYTVEDLYDKDDSFLDQLGITSPKHRRKILKGIKDLQDSSRTLSVDYSVHAATVKSSNQIFTLA